MSPLDRNASFKKIAEMFSSAKEIIVAAPYFGDGAAEQLGLVDTEASVTVICDLFSGGCNPWEVDRIRKVAAKPTVKRLAGLHAKIYLTESDVVIGSANPSSNGLGFEGKELVGNVEGCVHSSDPSVVAAWRSFFEDTINNQATDVEDADIERAIPLFNKRRKGRTRSDVGTLLAEMRANRERFKDKEIYFYLYEGEKLTDEEQKTIEEEQIRRNSDKISAYFDWPDATPGAYIIDLSYSPNSTTVVYGGIWRVVQADHVVPFGKNRTKLVVYETTDIQGLKIPKADQKHLCRIAQNGLAEHPEFYLSAFEADLEEAP